MSFGILTIMGNHIGNRLDIPKRLEQSILDNDLIVYEHDETFKNDLAFLNIKLINDSLWYNVQEETIIINKIIKQLLLGKNVLFILENGMPGLADPGLNLINQCYKNNIDVKIIPGPSIISVLPAIAGLPNVGTAWTFEECFTNNETEIYEKINNLKDINHNLAILNRYNTKLILQTMLDIFKEDRMAAICINIGLQDQKIIRGYLSELLNNSIIDNIKLELTSIVCSGKSF